MISSASPICSKETSERYRSYRTWRDAPATVDLGPHGDPVITPGVLRAAGADRLEDGRHPATDAVLVHRDPVETRYAHAFGRNLLAVEQCGPEPEERPGRVVCLRR